MIDLHLISESPEETLRIGRIVGENLKGGDIVALIGELGSGKTCLTQGIARGAGVSERYQITSPTFTLVNEYPGRIPFVHLDIYRLSGSRDLVEMGYEDYFYGGSVVVIEWAEKIGDLLPGETIYINLEYLDENRRKILISGENDRIMKIRNALKEGGFH
ncbi:MAG: tRNA (adenosine(37)-N6)-threonylcarbamoyltransferase complex ATPase subunit type 1 TsaE [Syntrophales bacterium]